MRTDPALIARAAALKLLAAALSRRQGFDVGLDALQGLGPQDRAFARALAMATLRRLGPIDRMLDTRLSREPPASVRDLLRIGLAQAFWLETPEFAAVDTTVALAPEPFRGLVNAVLRGQLREGPPPDDLEALAPSWLFARWRTAWGATAATSIAGTIAAEPPTDLSFKIPPRPDLTEALDARPIPGGTWRTRRRGDLAAWPGYPEGDWWVQDAAAAIPARLLAPAAGQKVLDLCAAPGGKTFQLASAGAETTAVDRSEARLELLKKGLRRLKLRAETVVADAAEWADTTSFDGVLLDAPCSGTGTFRRHPDLLWNARPGDIATLASLQARLLASAAGRVRPGGRLVYSVCSLEREEGEDQARMFLRENSTFEIDRPAIGEAGAPADSLTKDGWLRVLPHQLEDGLDGFFVVRLRRRG